MCGQSRSWRATRGGAIIQLFEQLLRLGVARIAAKHDLRFGARFRDAILAQEELGQGHTRRQIVTAGKRGAILPHTVVGAPLLIVHLGKPSVGVGVERGQQQCLHEGALGVIEIVRIEKLPATLHVHDDSLPAAPIAGNIGRFRRRGGRAERIGIQAHANAIKTGEVGRVRIARQDHARRGAGKLQALGLRFVGAAGLVQGEREERASLGIVGLQAHGAAQWFNGGVESLGAEVQQAQIEPVAGLFGVASCCLLKSSLGLLQFAVASQGDA